MIKLLQRLFLGIYPTKSVIKMHCYLDEPLLPEKKCNLLNKAYRVMNSWLNEKGFVVEVL